MSFLENAFVQIWQTCGFSIVCIDIMCLFSLSSRTKDLPQVSQTCFASPGVRCRAINCLTDTIELHVGQVREIKPSAEALAAEARREEWEHTETAEVAAEVTATVVEVLVAVATTTGSVFPTGARLSEYNRSVPVPTRAGS